MKLILALILAAGMASAQTTVNITNSLIGPVTQNFSNTQVNVSEAIITGAVVNASVTGVVVEASITNSFAPVNNVTNDVSISNVVNVGNTIVNNTNSFSTVITNNVQVDVAGVIITNIIENIVLSNSYFTTITSGVSSVSFTGAVDGAITFAGSGVTQTGNVFNFSGGSSGEQILSRTSNDLFYISSLNGWTNNFFYPDLSESLSTNDPDNISSFFNSSANWTNWIPFYTNGYFAAWTNGQIRITDPKTQVNRAHGWYRSLSFLKTNNWRATMLFTPGAARFKSTSYSQVGMFLTNSLGIFGFALQYHNNNADVNRLYFSRHTSFDGTLGAATMVSGDQNPVIDYRANVSGVIGLRMTFTNGTFWGEVAYPRATMPLDWIEYGRVNTTNNNSTSAIGIYLLPFGSDIAPHYIDSFHIGSYP